MGILTHLEPKDVFYYFEEICKIPHGSGNIHQISDYLVGFAKERNLFFVQDAVKNVIIVKEASKGYEEEPPVIIQGHMDMVAVKTSDCDIDMEKEGLRLAEKDGYIYAEGTSLGGDDGIAVAYALALLDSDTIKHPRLEVVITVDEETGMDGARAIDLSMLKGKRLLNIDSEEEGIFLTSCAGGARLDLQQDLTAGKEDGIAYELLLSGLLGGHSGVEIHKGRGNANHLLGGILWELLGRELIYIAEIKGGLADNAIPREAKAMILVKEGYEEALKLCIQEEGNKIKTILGSREPDFLLEVKKVGRKELAVLTKESAEKSVALLYALPNGVMAMSADIDNLVETSINNGQMELTIGEDGKANFHIRMSVRSSVDDGRIALSKKVQSIVTLAGGTMSISGEYTGWQYRENSILRDKVLALYEKMYGEKPKVEAIHAGLECGILSSKIPDLDCISFGPDMKAIHTTQEVLHIESTKRAWEFIIQLLEEKG
ncbi:beta-Ala-His dipeptidase [Lachnospiraceae bacterium OttesenSCG-928-D06]|nr:beta-Ala-His dipeptidase [Lachnospiraceae bacterium OttesenSCG-928-D06]